MSTLAGNPGSCCKSGTAREEVYESMALWESFGYFLYFSVCGTSSAGVWRPSFPWQGKVKNSHFCFWRINVAGWKFPDRFHCCKACPHGNWIAWLICWRLDASWIIAQTNLKLCAKTLELLSDLSTSDLLCNYLGRSGSLAFALNVKQLPDQGVLWSRMQLVRYQRTPVQSCSLSSFYITLSSSVCG